MGGGTYLGNQGSSWLLHCLISCQTIHQGKGMPCKNDVGKSRDSAGCGGIVHLGDTSGWGMGSARNEWAPGGGPGFKGTLPLKSTAEVIRGS